MHYKSLYKAFGETRYTLNNLYTDYHFTGQREQSELGIYWFNSRWYDGSLGRFLSPDSIVPTSTQGTQAWDRYAFVNNNPVRYNDPTGHRSCEEDGYNCPGDETKTTPPPPYCPDGSPIGPCLPPPPPPPTATLHPLDSNVVSVTLIYDFSQHPPKPIGEIVVSYHMDGNVHVDPTELLLGLLPIPRDPLSATDVALGLIESGVKELEKQLVPLGIETAACPECTFVTQGVKMLSYIVTANKAVTIDSHLETTIYYYPPKSPLEPTYFLSP